MIIVLYTLGPPFTGDTMERQALGGSESAFISVARELARMGHEVHACCPCTEPGLYDGVRYWPAEEVGRWTREPCDLFICSRFHHVFALDLKSRTRQLWMHDILDPQNAAFLRPLLGRIDSIFCLTRFHANQVGSVLPKARGKLRVSANGVDPALIAAAIGGAEKRHRILFTSRAERGLWEALDAYESLADRSLEFVYCSYGSQYDPRVEAIERSCFARMDALAAAGFRVARGSFAKAELYRLIAESKAVIYPCGFAEIFCISALEAQACGTVYHTVDAFALSETVAYRGVPPGDAAAFLERLRLLLSDETLRRRLEEQGRRHAARYSWRSVAETFLRTEKSGPAPRPAATPSRRRIAREGARAATAAAACIVENATRRPASPNAGATPPTDGVPTISCLTVTFDRLILLKRAIASYCDQTYPAKELVIVSDGSSRYLAAIEDHLAALGRDDIRLVAVEGRRTLGALRNLSLERARGDIICQWDDDDLSHPERLGTQAGFMLEQGAQACFLTDHLQLFERDRRLFWTDWTHDGNLGGKWQLAPGTLMMIRDSRFRYPEQGDAASRGEDSALLDSLYDRLRIARLGGAGHLYLYTYHGRNTFSEEHHRGLGCHAGATSEFLARHETGLREALRYYRLPTPLAVCATGGAVYGVRK